MDEDQIEPFRQALLNLRLELQAEEKSSGNSGKTVELDQSRTGRLTRMDAMQGQQMALEATRRLEQRLIKIEGALRRIESGDYGLCYICEEEIDPRRLTVDPTNTRCIQCVDK
jgi:RNA polymerase-binding transcription factor